MTEQPLVWDTPGYWKLNISWGDNSGDISASFADLRDCVAVVDKYGRFDQVTIEFVALDDPARF